ncbi:MAG: TrkH family potassium uptake protein [Saprospiraceae bacterium]
MINFPAIVRVLGVLLLIIGLLMWTGLPVSYLFDSGDMGAIGWSGLVCVGIGGFFWWATPRDDRAVRKREGYLIVALGWLVMTTFGMLPYLLSGVIPHVADAFFETVSGMTTTGASVLTDIEAAPEGILYWRSLTQWIGGMGIIVLTVAIFPLLGIGGVELFVAEAPGPTSDKLHPRISETAKRLWLIYVGLTGVLCLLLFAEGMTFYDAVNHALTTMATGGFSTKNASMAAFSPAIQYTTAVFMFLAGTNFTVTYFALKGRFSRVWASDEFKAYVFMIVLFTVAVTLSIHAAVDISWEQAFRDGMFQVLSLITTTGFVSADYTAWSGGLTLFFFILLFVGASAGSTSGGIKVIRHLVFFKNSFLEFKRILHPRAIVPLRLNGEVVKGRIITHIIIFLLLYMMIFLLGSLVLAWMGMDFMTAIGAVATSLGNVELRASAKWRPM